VIRSGSKYKYLPVGWFWYMGTLVPVIGLVQVGEQAMADRYTYITLTGLFIIICWGISDLLQGRRHQKLILNLSSFTVIFVLSVSAWFQTSYWRNNSSLFQHALKVTKGNYVIYNNFGALLSEEGKLEEAILLYRQAIEAVPDYPNAFNNLGIAYYRLGRYQEAIRTLKHAVQTKGDFAEAYYNLGVAYNKTGCYPEAAEAFRSVIKIKPDDAEALYNLGVIYGRLSEHNEEMECYNRAIAVKPDFSKAYDGLGCALIHQNKFNQAIACLQQAIKLDPNSPTANRSLLIALIQQGRIKEATALAGRALRTTPDLINIIDRLAWISATHRGTIFYNPRHAVKLAEQVCKLNGYADAKMLDTLAVAYAAVNRYSEAVATAEKAVQVARSAGDKSLMSQIQQRLDLYKKNRPYVETTPNKS
jgi:tetratricopeptide (TPR) repeat protein